MKSLLVIGVVTLILSGCGGVDRAVASLTGVAKTCIEGANGVKYSVIQMTSGAFYELQQTPTGPALVVCK